MSVGRKSKQEIHHYIKSCSARSLKGSTLPYDLFCEHAVKEFYRHKKPHMYRNDIKWWMAKMSKYFISGIRDIDPPSADSTLLRWFLASSQNSTIQPPYPFNCSIWGSVLYSCSHMSRCAIKSLALQKPLACAFDPLRAARVYGQPPNFSLNSPKKFKLKGRPDTSHNAQTTFHMGCAITKNIPL